MKPEKRTWVTYLAHSDNDQLVIPRVHESTTTELEPIARCQATLVIVNNYKAMGSPRSKNYRPPSTTTETHQCVMGCDHTDRHVWSNYNWTGMVEVQKYDI